MDDGVDLADVGQELVTQALALTCSGHQTRDIDKFDCGRDDDFGFGDFLQNREPLVGHGDDSDIGIDRAKRVVGRLRLA